MKVIYVNEANTAQIILESTDGLKWYVKNMPATGLPCWVDESDEPFMIMQIKGALNVFVCHGDLFKILN